MESLLVIAAAAALALLLGRTTRRRVGFIAQVESVSMAPTLAPGQRVLAWRPGAARPLRRGDIVVVDSQEIGRPIIKRIVGLPGEHVSVGADGQVEVARDLVVEPYVVHRGGTPGVFDVPSGHLLLLGDNRVQSSDARVWREPYVPVSAVLGRVVRFESRAAADGRDPGSPRCGAAPSGSRSPSAATRGGG